VSKLDIILQKGGMSMNSLMLKSVMTLHRDTNKDLANFLGLSEQSVCNKINENGTEFKLGEIRRIKNRYRLSPAEVDTIFFDK
jgi:hypothetical protein